MNKALKELFGPIQAGEALKDRTKVFLAERTRGYASAGPEKRVIPACAVACACLLLVTLGGRWLYFTPTAEISIDINPSIELSVNRFDRVIAVTGFSEDGQDLSSELDIKYQNYAEAVGHILHHDRIAALLSGDEIMTITVVGSDGRQSARLLSDIEMCTAGQRNTYCFFARPEEAAAAREAGLSCGKYRAFLALQLLAPDITPETVQGMTMREIRDMIARLSPDGGRDALSSGGWGNGHHGDSGGRRGGWRHGWNGRAPDE